MTENPKKEEKPKEKKPAKPTEQVSPKVQKPVPDKPTPVPDKPAPAAPEKPDERKEAKPVEKPSQRKGPRMLLFNRWDTSAVQIRDLGLKDHITLSAMAVPRTGGKYGPGHFTKNRMSLTERFMNKLMVSGHRGKKHKISSGNHVFPGLAKIESTMAGLSK